MTTLDQKQDRSRKEPDEKAAKGGHGRWMMVACCVPMLAVAVALVASGVVGAGFLIVAVMCTAMMALMMVGMSGGKGGGGTGAS